MGIEQRSCLDVNRSNVSNNTYLGNSSGNGSGNRFGTSGVASRKPVVVLRCETRDVFYSN